MIKFLKAAPVVFLIGTMVTAILYQKTLLGIWLTTEPGGQRGKDEKFCYGYCR